jgi:uncharacterized membrane protein YphA (DoxX/SURF4 family)
MHPLSIFPTLLDFGLLAPAILRIVASFFLFYLAKKKMDGPRRWTIPLFLIAGIMILVGLYTQIVALFAIILIKFDFYTNYYKNRNILPVPSEIYFLYIIVGIIFLSLMFTGPGFLAFDLPL